MTAQETERIDAGSTAASPGSRTTAAAGKAYERRMRRSQSVAERRLTTTGSPITSALTRVPFVGLIILLLAGGVVGVLYLNTLSDAAGLRASDSRRTQLDLNTQIEAANKNIADLKNPARLAAEAQALGLVPAGDAAIISVGADGKGSIIGTPTPVPTPAPAAPAALPNAAAATTAPAAAASTAAASATSAAAKPAPAKTTPVKATPAKTTPAKATPAKAAAAKTTPAKTTPAKAAPAQAAPAKSTPAKTTPAARTTPKTTTSRPTTPTTGAGQ